jgi:hypothetical protein
MDSAITAPPLHTFLADAVSGRAVIDRLWHLLDEKRRVLVWGPRVGAIELAQDLLLLWPGDGQVVGLNPGGLMTRTRLDGADSDWVQWVDLGPAELARQVMQRVPTGLVATYLHPALQPVLPELLGGPWGFVTAIAAASAEDALAQLSALSPAAAARLDVLVAVSEQGTSTFITEVAELRAGAFVPAARLVSGTYVTVG